MKKQLYQLANTILMHDYAVTESGLLNGKMGVAVFLYHCSRMLDSEIYSDLADKYIDHIYGKMGTELILTADFANGLPGVGWGIEYLTKEKFLDANIDEALEDVDKLILEKKIIPSLYTEMDIPLFEGGVYFLSRYKEASPNLRVKQNIIKLEGYYQSLLKDLPADLPCLLLFSLLYFFVEVKERSILSINDSVFLSINEKLLISLQNQKTNVNDGCLLTRFSEKHPGYFTKQVCSEIENRQFYQKVTDADRIDFLVCSSWHNALFFDNQGCEFQQLNINQLIDNKSLACVMTNIDKTKLTIDKGIAGLGLCILQNSLQQHKSSSRGI